MGDRMIDNIFSALLHRRNANVIREFVLWCVLCFEILLFMIAAITAGSKAAWVMMLIFTVGLAVLMAFRLTAVSLLYSVAAFHLIAFSVHFICYRSGNSVMNLLLFVLLLLLALAAVICSFIHNFARFNLDKVVMILVEADSVLILILQILLYAGRWSGYSLLGSLGSLMGYGKDFSGYWLGTVSFWMLLVVIDLYYLFFGLGLIDNQKNKIWKKVGGPGNLRSSVPSAGIQGIRGVCTGQIIYLNNRELVIGADKRSGADLVVPDAYVSKWHCAVRCNPGRGGNSFYEVLDRSTNGVYLYNGGRLPQNVWNRLGRGSVICIGGMEQQFRLL